ncbi:MAG: T9SS type A sorting domain-containing protein [Ignavibacteria bacterium]|nr:T9SS type A sorting domain-containing protein [Ignavibacteria bacterium]
MKKISAFLLALFLVFEISTVMAQVTVLPGNGSTSGNARAPQGSRRFINTKYIVLASELTTSGFSGAVTSVGWRWNVPSPPAATGPTSQSTATIGDLRVYLKDTVAGAVSIGSTFIDTQGAGYTKVIDGTISMPSGLAEINIDVPVGGPGTGTFTPTPGNAVMVIFVYRTTTTTLPTPLGSPNVFCTNLPAGLTLATYQSNTAGGSVGTGSSFRPETRFGAPLLPDDVGISATNLNDGRIFSVGKCYDFTATVKNFGTDPQGVIPVYYNVDGGPAVGPVNTVGPIAPNGTEDVTFSGGFALCGLTAGAHTINVYTDLQPSPPAVNRAPLPVAIIVNDKITTLPYVQNFTLPTGWTTSGVALWALAPCVNPDGVAADLAARANFYNVSAGSAALRSPEFDFTGISNPVLNFYAAYKTFATETDRLEVLISTDGGLTFSPASTPYNKTHATVPSLATLLPSTTSYTPTDEIQWRHETVDLSNVGNMSNVVIGFVGTTAFGNNCWIDNVIVSQPNSLCTDVVSGPGSYNCNLKVGLDFITTPLPPFNSGNVSDNQSSPVKNIVTSGDNSFGILPNSGDIKVNSGNQLDNSTPGTASITEYDNVTAGANIAANPSATSPDGSIFTPGEVYNDYWFTVTYDGNDQLGYATYNINIDLTTLFFSNPDQLYIMKRTDQTGAWNCLSTTRSGTILTASGLTDFSDFGIGGNEVQPVELASFVSSVIANSVTLNWATTSETNNAGFDIERSSVSGSWTKIANVSGNGTSTTPHSYSFTDRNVASGNYNYRLKQIDFNGNFEYFNLSNEVVIGIPAEFKLSQNYPNPFNPSTTISYEIPVDGAVSLKIFDMSGKEVMNLVDGVKNAGYYSINFNASNLSSGIYFYKLSANDFTSVKKMMLVK